MSSRALTVILTQRDVERLLDMKTAMRVVRRTLLSQARGRVLMPPKVYLTLPRGVGDFRAMPAYLASPPACGLKWVNVHPGNRAKGLPTVMAVIVLNDPRTGFPQAVLDGLFITRLRTGASGGVAAQALARRNSRVVGLVGCGAQAIFQLQALQESFTLREVRVWGYRKGEAAQFCRAARRRFPFDLLPVTAVRDCVTAADLVVTITTARAPVVKREWIAPGTHINAIGADAPGKQELDPAIVREATVVVDEREQAIHAGELNMPIRRGQFRPAQIHAELGEVLIGRATGRCGPNQITVFDSTGLALHDVAVAREAVRRALRQGIGRRLQLFLSR